MRTSGGAGGAGFGLPGDFGAMAEQWTRAMGEALRGFGAAPQPQDPWRSLFDGWAQLAGQGRPDASADLIGRFSHQARQWLGMMQQVAGQFAGHDASAEDIGRAWRDAMGMAGANPFGDLFRQMAGRGQSGFDQWYDQVAPMLNGMLLGGLRQEQLAWLRMPAYGLNREHQERLQALAAAQIELQEKNDAFNAIMFEAGREAFERFERKLAERSEPGRQLKTARALFDLWIDAAEEAYAEVALSKKFRRVYGDMVNAQMRVRAGVQAEVERMCELFGMPGRTEVDAAHRKIAELERQVRRLRDAVQTPQVARPAAKPAPAADASAAQKPAPARSAGPAAAARSKPAKAAKAAPARKRAAKPAIAEISAPEPLKPMAAKSSKTPSTARSAPAKTAKRSR